MRSPVTAVVLLLCAVAAVHSSTNEDGKQLLGRHDGHEPGIPKDVDDSSLLGRPDGHELYDKGKKTNPDADKNEDYEDLDYDDDDDDDENEDADTDDSSNDETEGPESVPDGGKRLIRCKRPLCEMACPNGFETDESGCQVCRCREKASKDEGSLLGRPDGHELYSKCADRPMCRMYCEMGFQTGADGCSVCLCLPNPCEGIKCAAGSTCQPQPCEDRRLCTKLSAKCVAGQSRIQCPEPMCASFCPSGYKKNAAGCMTCECAECPEPMCASFCPSGYKKNAAGCMTCECAEHLCGSAVCEEGQVCRNKSIGSLPARPSCTVKTLCESKKDKPVGLGAVLPQCEADGSFKPLQCNIGHSECWCVDGRGQEVLGTRTSVYVIEHKPKCVRNITVSMHVHMVLVVRHDVDIRGHLNTLNATIVDHVSTWLLIEKHYIKITKAEVQKSDDDNGKSSDETDYYDKDQKDDVPHLFVVEFIVVHDGSSDLPSAANYMQQRMRQGHCRITLPGGSTMDPDANTVKTDHKFAYEPSSSSMHDRFGYSHHSRAIRVGVCVTTGLLLILLIASIAAAINRRRRLRVVQFRHHRLVNPVLSEKNLLQTESGYVKTPEVVVADVAKEKEPIA